MSTVFVDRFVSDVSITQLTACYKPAGPRRSIKF